MDTNSHELHPWDRIVCILVVRAERRLQAARMSAIDLLPPEGSVPILSNPAFHSIGTLIAVSKVPEPSEGVGGAEPRASVLDCGGPPPLFGRSAGGAKRQRAAAVQNLAELAGQL